MLVNSRWFLVALIGTSAVFVSLIFLFHSSPADTYLSHMPLRPEFSLDQVPSDAHGSYHYLLANVRPSDTLLHSRTLGVASHIYVLSLPRRVDRRRSMSALARALDLQFEFVDALEATDTCVDQALEILERQRKEFKKKYFRHHAGVAFSGFAFPGLNEHPDNGQEFFDDGLSDQKLDLCFPVIANNTLIKTSDTSSRSKDRPLPCATPEDPFPDPRNETDIRLLPPWRILSRGMVACWVTHLRIVHRIAKLDDVNAVAIVLEDDVDMEFDIERRLRHLWPALPYNGWDIIMLGYCHSDEMANAPIAGAASVRPSFAPKCTHAYAISRSGARRLFQILSTPGFSYSRALDQAISWLIKTNKLRSYSIVPAVVIQDKLTPSDIWHPHTTTEGQNSSRSGNENGSKWRGMLVDSTLERVEMVEYLTRLRTRKY